MLERGDLQVDVLLLERDVPLVREVEVVPRDLVAEDRRALEGAEALLGDRAVILVDVVEARLEDDVGLPLLPEPDEQLEDVLPAIGERCTSKSWTLSALSGIPSSPVAARTSFASVSGGKPAAASASRSRTRRSEPRAASTSRAIVPPQPNSPSSVCGASTSAFRQVSITVPSSLIAAREFQDR